MGNQNIQYESISFVLMFLQNLKHQWIRDARSKIVIFSKGKNVLEGFNCLAINDVLNRFVDDIRGFIYIFIWSLDGIYQALASRTSLSICFVSRSDYFCFSHAVKNNKKLLERELIPMIKLIEIKENATSIELSRYLTDKNLCILIFFTSSWIWSSESILSPISQLSRFADSCCSSLLTDSWRFLVLILLISSSSITHSGAMLSNLCN